MPFGLVEGKLIHFIFNRKEMNQAVSQAVVKTFRVVKAAGTEILVDETDIGLSGHSEFPVFAPPESRKIVNATGHEDKTDQHVIHFERKFFNGIEDKIIEVRPEILEPQSFPLRVV